MSSRIKSVIVIVAMLVGVSPFALAQEAPAPLHRGPSPQTYGTVVSTAHTLGSYVFQPLTSGTTHGFAGSGGRYFNTGGLWEANVNLPAGARVTQMEIQACDEGAASLVATLYSLGFSGGGESETNHGSVTAFPGCAFASVFFATPITVENWGNSYLVQVQQTGASDGSTRFHAVRLYYTLQVAPAPGTARFTDVPVGTLAHQFVEALAAAGITTGCTPTEYCPNDAVTRAQMAIFIARALGLHWAP